MAELADQAQAHFKIEEKAIPVKEKVRGFCEIYGLEPLFLANEGKMLIFCPAPDAEKALQIMRQDSLGSRRNDYRPRQRRWSAEGKAHHEHSDRRRTRHRSTGR